MTDATPTQHQWEQSLLNSFIKLAQAPDGDLPVVYELGKNSSDRHGFQLMIEHLSQHPDGKKAFANRLSLGAIDLEQLHQLPDNTLGHLYAEHMLKNQLKPLTYPPAQNDFEFVSVHVTETHDIWHVVTGSSTDITGEIQLEAFCVAQFKASRFWLALLAKNLLKPVLYDIEATTAHMDALTRGWLMGKQAKPLFGIDWTTLWETPIDQIRSALNVELDPISF